MGDEDKNDLNDYANELLRELDRVFQEGIDKDVANSVTNNYDISINTSSDPYPYSNGIVSMPYDGDSFVSQQDRVERAFKYAADRHLLQSTEKNNIETSIGIIGEDEFKKRTKQVLGLAMTEEVIKKTKFTMMKDPHDQSVTTRARVFVFSEQELKDYIEKVLNSI